MITNKKSKAIYITSAFTAFILCLCLCFPLYSCKKENYPDPLTLVDFVVNVPQGRNAKVLQLTDPQVVDPSQQREEGMLSQDTCNKWQSMEDNCNKYIRKVVNDCEPDLIVITGDLVYGRYDDNGTRLIEFINFMESLSVPWAPVFGNHDNESAMGADWQSARLEEAENCLFKQRELTGNGNYTVGLVCGGKLIRTFFMLDSNGCGLASEQSKANGHTVTSPTFGVDQTDWFTMQAKNIIKAYPKCKNTFCFHIQPLVFEKAFFGQFGYSTQSVNSVLNTPVNFDLDNNDETFGYMGRALKTPWDNSEITYGLIKKAGADSVLVGHEHCNSGSVMYNGVRLQYGQKSSTYDRYNYINSAGEITGKYSVGCTPLIGGTLMSIDKKSGNITEPHIVLYN